jgi:hypothetical protein
MSATVHEKQTPEISNELLRRIIENVPEYRNKAAGLLWSSRYPNEDDCVVLINHSVRDAEFAAKRLIEVLEPEASKLDCIFTKVTNARIRYLTGRYILQMPHEMGRDRYAKVAEEVPKLRKMALEQLKACGPFDYYDLNVIWKYEEDEAVRAEQWQKFLDNLSEYDKNYYLYLVLVHCTSDLVNLAWPEYIKVAKISDLQSALRISLLRSLAWQELLNRGIDTASIVTAICEVEPSMEEGWEAIKQLPKKERRMQYQNLVTWERKTSDLIKDRAAEAWLDDNPTARDLGLILYRPRFRQEATRRLLAGEFSAEET